jgi:DNA-binding protein H-NS
MRYPDTSLDEDPEKQVAIRKILKLMEFWQIQPHELRGKPVFEPAPSASAEVRYRHPISGMTWDGVGSQPDWLRMALLKEGYTVDELRRAVEQDSESCPQSA